MSKQHKGDADSSSFRELFDQEWELIRAWGRIFLEASYLEVGAVSCVESSGAATINFLSIDLDTTAPLKRLHVTSAVAVRLYAWILNRQLDPKSGDLSHGIPEGFFNAVLGPTHDRGELFRLTKVCRGNSAAEAAAVALDSTSIPMIERALQSYPGGIIVAAQTPADAERYLIRLSVFFGWVSSGMLTAENAGAVKNALHHLPLLIGVVGKTSSEAISQIARLGVPVTSFALKGIVLEETVDGHTVLSWNALGSVSRSRPKPAPIVEVSNEITANVAPQRTVLLVEDDRDQREILQIMLESEGYAVIPAEDGRAALNLLQVNNVDAVITDLMMPNVDGRALVHSIVGDARFKHLPIMVLTAVDDGTTSEELLSAGARDYYVKNAKPKVLADRVKKLFEGVAKSS